MNELAHTLLTIQSRQLYGWQNGTRQHYVTLSGSTASCGERTHTCTFEITLTCLPDKLTAVHSGERLSRRYKTPRWPFSKLCSSLLCAYCSNKLPEQGPTKARLRVLSIMQLRACVHRRSSYAQLSPLYLLSTLYITHVIKYPRPSTAFLYCKRRKAGWGLGTRLAWAIADTHPTSHLTVSLMHDSHTLSQGPNVSGILFRTRIKKGI